MPSHWQVVLLHCGQPGNKLKLQFSWGAASPPFPQYKVEAYSARAPQFVFRLVGRSARSTLYWGTGGGARPGGGGAAALNLHREQCKTDRPTTDFVGGQARRPEPASRAVQTHRRTDRFCIFCFFPAEVRYSDCDTLV